MELLDLSWPSHLSEVFGLRIFQCKVDRFFLWVHWFSPIKTLFRFWELLVLLQRGDKPPERASLSWPIFTTKTLLALYYQIQFYCHVCDNILFGSSKPHSKDSESCNMTNKLTAHGSRSYSSDWLTVCPDYWLTAAKRRNVDFFHKRLC